jgi:acyl dehydratase
MLKTYAKGAAQSARLRLRPAAGGDLSRVAGDASPRRVREFTAAAQKVAEFCRVVHEPVADAVPVTYLHAEAFAESMELMSAREFPLPLVGMVHLANTVTQHEPVRVGEAVRATVWIEEIRAHAKGTEVVVATRFEVAGRLRVEETSTMLAKGVHVRGAAEAVVRERREFTPGTPVLQWRFTGGDASAYARVSGDRNPIHLNGAAAKAFGFPTRIAHGMYTAARALAAAQVRTRPFTWEVEFASPVLLPARVDVGVRRVRGEGEHGAEVLETEVLETEVWSPKKGKLHMRSRLELS